MRPPFAERLPKAPRRGPRAEGHTPGCRPVSAHLHVARQRARVQAPGGRREHGFKPRSVDGGSVCSQPSSASRRKPGPEPRGLSGTPRPRTWTRRRASPRLITALGPGADWAGASLGRGLPRPYVGATALAPRVCCKGPCAPAAVGTRPSFVRCQPRKASGAAWEGRGARAEATGVVTHGVERDWEGRASFGS